MSPFDFQPIVLDTEQQSTLNKEMGKYRKLSRRETKPSTCLLCGNPKTSFCNSHTLPQLCLRQIASDGKVLTIESIIGGNITKQRLGINQTGTFRIICNNCDNLYFKVYESQDSYVDMDRPTQRIMGQIAVKTCLSEMAKAREDVPFYEHLAEDYSSRSHHQRSAVRSIDNLDDERNYRIARAAADNNSRQFKTIYYERLNYTVPVAAQVMINPIVDLKGDIVNNLFNPSSSYHIEPLFANILPMAGESVLILFRLRKSKRCSVFDKQYQSISTAERQKTLLKSIMLYSDSIYFSPQIENLISANGAFASICSMNIDRLAPYYVGATTQQAENRLKAAAERQYAMDNLPDVPNLLSSEYSLEKRTSYTD